MNMKNISRIQTNDYDLYHLYLKREGLLLIDRSINRSGLTLHAWLILTEQLAMYSGALELARISFRFHILHVLHADHL